jgi:hypothetical protein
MARARNRLPRHRVAGCTVRAAFAVLLAALAMAPAGGSLAAPPPPPGGPVVTLIPLDGPAGPAGAPAVMDVGTVSAADGGRIRDIVIRRRIAVRIDSARATAGAASLSAALVTEVPGVTARIDGMTVSTVPRMIAPTHRIGTAVVHEVELTIPRSAPEGAFATDLLWLAELD